MDPFSVRRHLEAAVEIAEAAGAIALRYFRQPVEVIDKSQGAGFDPVTAADREIEAFVREQLSERFPEHGILGEEHGETDGRSPYRWVIDPIDGTRAFMTGMPAWGVLLGLADASRAWAGLMHQPFLHETFLGCDDGAWLRSPAGERRLHTRATQALADALLYCTDPSMFPEEPQRSAFGAVSRVCRLTRFGGDCYAYCLLALGQIDLVIEGGLQPYDIIPLIPMIEAAGGVVSSWSGKPALAGGHVVAAANAEIHARALEHLQPAAP